MEKIKLNIYYFLNILIIITINLKFIEAIKVFCGRMFSFFIKK